MSEYRYDEMGGGPAFKSPKSWDQYIEQLGQWVCVLLHPIYGKSYSDRAGLRA